MPVILQCGGCGDTTEDNPSKGFSGVGWLKEPTLGGVRVLCPKCQTTNEDYLIERERKELIEIYVAGAIERARIEAREKYTPEYVKQSRKEREQMLLPLFKKT